MKNKIIIYLISIIFIFLIAGIGFLIHKKNTEIRVGTLFINGKEIFIENIKIYKDYAEIPFISIFKELGGEVNWINNSSAELIINNREFILDLSSIELTEKNKKGTEEWDFLLLPPGTKHGYRQVLYQEVIIDDTTLRCALTSMNIVSTAYVDYRQAIVYIEK